MNSTEYARERDAALVDAQDRDEWSRQTWLDADQRAYWQERARFWLNLAEFWELMRKGESA